MFRHPRPQRIGEGGSVQQKVLVPLSTLASGATGPAAAFPRFDHLHSRDSIRRVVTEESARRESGTLIQGEI